MKLSDRATFSFFQTKKDTTKYRRFQFAITWFLVFTCFHRAFFVLFLRVIKNAVSTGKMQLQNDNLKQN